MCTQKRGPLTHSDMISWRAPYKEDNLQGDTVQDMDVDRQVSSPEWEYIYISILRLLKMNNDTGEYNC